MEKIDRLQHLHRIFKSRRYPVSTRILAEELECTEKTVRRNIDTLRNLLNAPIVNVSRKGWQYVDPEDLFELPGLWLTSQELISLASMLKITDEMDSDFIDQELTAIKKQINQLLENRGVAPDAFSKKIKILPTNKQVINSSIFNTVSSALINNKQINIDYQSYNGAQTCRKVSPKKLVYYQENWYLDCYCHLREALRSFKVSRIFDAELLTSKSKNISAKQLNRFFADSYGMFSGKAKHTAELEFYDDAAREVAQQQWHPQQTGEWNGETYKLSFPYSDDRELVRDIFKYTNSVKVIKPAKLKNKIKRIIRAMGGVYQ